MKYLRYFETISTFIEAYNNEYVEPWISYTEENQEINCSNIKHRYTITPLTFECLTGGDLSIKNANTSYNRNFEYSLNDEEWTAFDLPENTDSKLIVTLFSGDTISFRRDNDDFSGAQFISDSNLTFNIYGNILSLQYGSEFRGQTELRNTNKNAFGATFKGTGVVDASNLMLTPSSLSVSCYSGMFYGCTSLTTAPALPATTLAVNCYSNMFNRCTSLTTAPALPATTLAYNCYESMFSLCSSLTIAPTLPATTLAGSCYSGMFYYCTFLNYIKCLASDISAGSCTNAWLAGVATSGTFVKSPNISSWPSGNNGIPSGWIVQDA